MFNDYEGKPIFFNNKNKPRFNLLEQEVQTDADETEYQDEEVQVREREEEGTQTNLKEMINKEDLSIDDKKLENFLKNAFNFMNDALTSRIDENFEFFDEEEEETEEYTTSLIMRLPCIQNNAEKNTKISDISWNSTGKILAIAYYVDNHYGPCSHTGYINFLKFSDILEAKTFKEKIQVETNSCIKSIESHPKNPNLFVCSSYIGEIYLINLTEGNDKDQIQHISKVDSYFHKECAFVKWIKYGGESSYYILSISEEGRLLLWNPEDKLALPTIGFSLTFKIGKNSFPITPTCLSENPFEPFNYVIGTVDGNLYKCTFTKPSDDKFDYIFQQSSGTVWRKAVKQLMCNMNDNQILEMKSYMERFCRDKSIVDLNAEEFFKLKPDVSKLYKNALKSNYEKHISVVTGVEFNPFVKNFFLTCSFDGSLRVYHQNFFGSKYILSNNLNDEYYTAAQWSPFKPTLIISGTSNGKLSFLKIHGRSLKPIHQIERKVENSLMSYPVNEIKCNSFYKNIIAVTYEDGILDLIKLSDDLYESKYDEINKINKIISDLLN